MHDEPSFTPIGVFLIVNDYTQVFVSKVADLVQEFDGDFVDLAKEFTAEEKARHFFGLLTPDEAKHVFGHVLHLANGEMVSVEHRPWRDPTNTLWFISQVTQVSLSLSKDGKMLQIQEFWSGQRVSFNAIMQMAWDEEPQIVSPDQLLAEQEEQHAAEALAAEKLRAKKRKLRQLFDEWMKADKELPPAARRAGMTPSDRKTHGGRSGSAGYNKQITAQTFGVDHEASELYRKDAAQCVAAIRWIEERRRARDKTFSISRLRENLDEACHELQFGVKTSSLGDAECDNLIFTIGHLLAQLAKLGVEENVAALARRYGFDALAHKISARMSSASTDEMHAKKALPDIAVFQKVLRIFQKGGQDAEILSSFHKAFKAGKLLSVEEEEVNEMKAKVQSYIDKHSAALKQLMKQHESVFQTQVFLERTRDSNIDDVRKIYDAVKKAIAEDVKHNKCSPYSADKRINSAQITHDGLVVAIMSNWRLQNAPLQSQMDKLLVSISNTRTVINMYRADLRRFL